MKSAQVVEERIEENRKNFKPVAEHGAKLYFSVQELGSLDPMYQWSMKWFRELFTLSFTYSEKIKETKARIKQLKGDFTKVLYSNVCRSLFEHHKLMFAFSISIKLNEESNEKALNFSNQLKELEQMQAKMENNDSMIKKKFTSKDKKSDNQSMIGGNNAAAALLAQQQAKNEEEKLRIPKEELKYLLTGLISPDVEVEERNNPVESFMDSKMWQSVLELATLDHFDQLPDEIEKNPVTWRNFVQVSQEPIPEPIASTLPDFAQILLYRVMKPENTITMIKKYIERAIGQFFIKPIIYGLDEIFQDSKPYAPIILILTPGNDPMEQIKKFGEEKGKLPYPVSLGKGQGEKAKALINEIKQYGGWVVLQNCHLATSFLPELEQLIEQLQPTISAGKKKNDDDEKKGDYVKPPHNDFRLWLTSMSDDNFPFSILQSSIKLTSEPPKGVKSSLIRSFNQIESSKAEKEFFNSNTKMDQWKKLYLSLSFFHGIIRERRRYGALGWNLKYDFNDSDFRISMRQLHMMIDTFEEIPFKALSYLTGECNYGGRVTDDFDRRTLNTILKDFYNPLCLGSDHQFCSGAPEYFIKQEGELIEFMEYVNELPDSETPALVGLHPNANITYAINESVSVISDVLSISKSSGGDAGGNQNLQAIKMAKEILFQIREPFKIKEVEKKYPFKYEDSMNSVLLQELARFNTLIECVKSSLDILIKTLEGKIVMTAEIEKMLTSLLNNGVPDNWRGRSYPSKKPLLSYVKDFVKRLTMLEDWIEHGQPSVFWISGFFFTQSFLTGVKQNFARKYRYPIDKVTFSFQVLKYEVELTSQPENGCYVKGLFLEGAGWNNKEGILEESIMKQLFVDMPAMHFLPVLEKEISLDEVQAAPKKKDDSGSDSEEKKEKPIVKSLYNCPVYKTSARAGTLSTTGHSTNYILTTQIPTFESEDIWVKRSVALLSRLDD